MKNFYKELDNALKSYEEARPYHTLDIDSIASKVDWCWKWKKITEPQMEELANRVVKIYERN